MRATVLTVPCLSDNYAYLIRNEETDQTVLVDAPEAAPIQDALDREGWTLDQILITHHHGDHIDAVDTLRGKAEVVGAARDATRLPKLDRAVAPGDTIDVAGLPTHVLEARGHTTGHIAYHIPQLDALFPADSLMVMGCGRVFEGTMEEMFGTVSALGALPDDTRVFSGHEYALTNIAFARSIDPDNVVLEKRAERAATLRASNSPTGPATLAEERQTNPYLRLGDPGIRAALGLVSATDAEVFAEIRRRKDAFRG